MCLRFESYPPIRFTLDHAGWNLKEAARAEPAYDLFHGASWTSYFLTIVAPHQVVQRVEREIHTWGLGIEFPFLLFFLIFAILDQGSGIASSKYIGTGAADVGVWKIHFTYSIGACDKGSGSSYRAR